SNAVKYTPSGGKVEFTAMHLPEGENQNYRIEIKVKDNGIGISEEMHDKVFAPFVQEHVYDENGTATGTGLGLSIVKKIVDLMGGEITLESEKDHGSTFIVRLPMEITIEDLQIKEEAEVPEDSILQGTRVLLCEDSDLNVEIAKRLLAKMGVTMDRAANGKEGLELFLSSEPGTYQAILMDVHMPVMGGLEATELIRSSSHLQATDIPIIAMTADAYEEDVKKCLIAGMNAHLAKPIAREKLYETLVRQFTLHG
nr:response regulator [Lachnospiraceae bacterium]